MALTLPTTLSPELSETLARAQAAALEPQELARRAEARRIEDLRREHELVLSNAKMRETPTDRDVRWAVLLSKIPRTQPLDAMLRGLAWRQKRRLPSGEKPGLVMVFGGANGSGKTSGAAWIVARWPGSALFVTADSLGSVPDSEWGDYVAERARWKTVGLLVIDDVGVEKSAKAKRYMVERCGPLLLARYNEGLASIVTTTVPDDAFCEHYLSTEDRVLGVRGGVEPVRGNMHLASRLSMAQRDNGCDYWYEHADAPCLRGPGIKEKVGHLPRATFADVAALG